MKFAQEKRQFTEGERTWDMKDEHFLLLLVSVAYHQ